MTAIGEVTGWQLPADIQETNERRYCKTHLNNYIATAIRDNPDMEACVTKGVEILEDFLSRDYYASKAARLAQIDTLMLEDLVREIFVGIAYCRKPTLYVSITAQLAGRVGFDDHEDSIATVGEMVAVLHYTGAFKITKEDKQASLMLVSCIPLPLALEDAIDRAMFVMPMVSEPAEIESNFTSPYLTYNECQILGSGNAHAGDICLDVLNTQNKIALKLDLDFLSSVEEEATYDLDTQEKWNQWHEFKRQSYTVYDLIAHQGNKFWLTNKVDKRGRMYSQGYHITTQGSAFKKAMIELHHEELITGVPHGNV
jgi:hypothetical protein